MRPARPAKPVGPRPAPAALSALCWTRSSHAARRPAPPSAATIRSRTGATSSSVRVRSGERKPAPAPASDGPHPPARRCTGRTRAPRAGASPPASRAVREQRRRRARRRRERPRRCPGAPTGSSEGSNAAPRGRPGQRVRGRSRTAAVPRDIQVARDQRVHLAGATRRCGSPRDRRGTARPGAGTAVPGCRLDRATWKRATAPSSSALAAKKSDGGGCPATRGRGAPLTSAARNSCSSARARPRRRGRRCPTRRARRGACCGLRCGGRRRSSGQHQRRAHHRHSSESGFASPTTRRRRHPGRCRRSSRPGSDEAVADDLAQTPTGE